MTREEMIKKFQCVGCVSGPDPKTCPAFKLDEQYGFKCSGHVIGTMVGLQLHLALGMPKGFNRSSPQDDMMATRNTLQLALWLKGTNPAWDKFNLPTWALEEDGCLFVRTYAPRTDRGRIDVLEGGTLALVPNAIDVSKFTDDFD